jgi:hypothetical protein
MKLPCADDFKDFSRPIEGQAASVLKDSCIRNTLSECNVDEIDEDFSDFTSDLGHQTSFKPQHISNNDRALIQHKFPPVGIRLHFDHVHFDQFSTFSARQAMMQQLKVAIAMSLEASDERVRIIALDKPNRIVNLNILGDLNRGDPRSPMQLACDLVAQSRDPLSPLRISAADIRSADIQNAAFRPIPTTRRRKQPKSSATVGFQMLITDSDGDMLAVHVEGENAERERCTSIVQGTVTQDHKAQDDASFPPRYSSTGTSVHSHIVFREHESSFFIFQAIRNIRSAI